MRTRTSILLRGFPVIVLFGLSALGVGCSDEPATGGTGGAPATQGGAPATQGGTTSNGGTTSQGGAVTQGGTTSQGGAPVTQGGASAKGGTTSAGGTSASGGASGGTTASGGGGGTTASGGGGGTTASGGATGGGASGAASGGSGGGGSFTLTSPGHMDGAKFASKYTCTDKGFDMDVQPELNWTGAPAGTKSFAITFMDRSLTEANPVNKNGFHWVIYNIPATETKLAETTGAPTAPAKSVPNTYLGPCPNFGAGGGAPKTDNYEFTLYALSTETLTFTGTGTTGVQNAEKALEMSNLGKAKLKGTSDAKAP